MKCKYCPQDSENINGWWFSDGGSTEKEGDYICYDCFIKREKAFQISKGEQK